MSGFTRFGSGIWDWLPFTSLDMSARNLWLALYTSAEGKRLPAGLWHGGVSTMAEAARMSGDAVVNALDVMIETDLIAYDKQRRVVRLCELPDGGERPANGKVIYGWWSRFKTVPECPTRDAHVRTLRWLVEQGSVTPDHEKAWGATFATIRLPIPRSKNRKSFQGDLFPPPQEHPDTVSDTVSTTEECRTLPSDLTPMISVVPIPYPIPYGSGSGSGTGSGSSFSSSGSEQGEPPVDRDQRPRLALVPPQDGPFTVDDLVAVFGRNHIPVPPELRDRLHSAIYELRSCGVGPADLALLSAAVAAGGIQELPSTEGAKRLTGWERAIPLTDARLLLEVIERSRERRSRIDEQCKAFAEIREKAGL